MTLAEVLTAIDAHRFTYAGEVQLHEGLELAFTNAGLTVHREVVLAGGRVDFLIDRIAVEVKLAGTCAGVYRQLLRYATSDLVDELLLITTRARHLTIPRDVAGKPLTVVRVGGAA